MLEVSLRTDGRIERCRARRDGAAAEGGGEGGVGDESLPLLGHVQVGLEVPCGGIINILFLVTLHDIRSILVKQL